jgi:hypothetical protein
MPSIRSSRSCNVIIFAALSTVIVAGCAGGTASPGATSASSATSTPSATTASPTTVSQAAWVAGIKALEKKMTDASDAGGTITSKWMRDASKQMGGCTAELSRLGPAPATDNEQVAFLAAKRGCAAYEKAAKCLAPAKADSPGIPKCFDAMNRGSELFATAHAAVIDSWPS